MICHKLGVIPVVGRGIDTILRWRKIAQLVDTVQELVHIAVVGKYTHLKDAYKSMAAAVEHACWAANKKPHLLWIEAEDLEPSVEADAETRVKRSRTDSDNKYDKAWATLRSAHGILVPGGFGDRGTEGKISAARYARENNIPYLGLCLGFQIAGM